ncbi:MAG: cellulose biosynthesis cyclic di-GMP-binding regulatory protein BcsB [Chloroflexi bacterium]|nr:cellulose biosynthesis cyclic di-GMP-binding regulatory protein BcsB [Chloroflexota bacterium]
MNKKLSNIFSSFLLCMVLLSTVTTTTYAQTATNNGVVSLADLGKSEISLIGPYDTSSISFGLPADWKFTGNARIELNITSAFNSIMQDGVTQSFGGTLAVSFNRVTVATLVLDKVGTSDYVVEIPSALLVSPRVDGLMELKFTLNSGVSCVANQFMSVVINASSRTTFLYEEQRPDTSLMTFPRPIVQNTIYPDQALVVIPDKPTSAELQSALTVASGLGNLSSNTLKLDLVTVSQLTEEQKAATHLIFVGKASSIPSLAELALPLKAEGGSFTFAGGASDNGVVEMINSPWSVKNVVLVVSGNTDLGTQKAAQAVSTGVFQQNTSPNLAIVESVQDAPASAPLVTDQTFADLGYGAQQFSNRGVDSQSYNFYIPSGSSVSTDAYLDLAYGNSALLDYKISGLVVLLNNQPIGSVRFDDVSAGQSINHSRITIPPSVAIPGNNRIEIRSNLEPLDHCTDPNLHGLWSVIWPDSRLHLPFTSSPLNTQSTLDLSAYPAPMIFDSTLGTTAVVFNKSDVDSWRSFIRVASFLGDRSNGSITRLSVFFDDEIGNVDLSQYNLIVVGRPSQLALMDKLNESLPVPFEKGSDTAQSTFLQITYQVPPEVPVGYVELMPSPWNNEKVLITAFGNNTAGLNSSISALVDSTLRSQLAGDFAVVNDTRVQAVDTRLALPVIVTPVPPESNEGVAAPIETNPLPPINRPAWLISALALVIVLIVVVIAIAVYINFRGTRKNN